MLTRLKNFLVSMVNWNGENRTAMSNLNTTNATLQYATIRRRIIMKIVT